MKQNKKIIGLTGTMASGKSTAAAFFKDAAGIPVIDADKVGHEILTRSEVVQALTEAFGPQILKDGAVVRKALAEAAFVDEVHTEMLNSITHPVICREIRQQIDAFLASDEEAPFMIIEAYGLLQSELKTMVDEIWAVGCDKRTRIRRIMQRNGLTLEEARTRVNSQWPEEKYREAADVYLDGSGTEAFLREQCKILWKRYTDTI